MRQAARLYRTAGGVWRAAFARLGGLPAAGDVRVSYGHPRLPRPDERAFGGIVKLQALDRLYPNSARRFNVLYLVSSRLPETPVTLARAARAKGAAVVVNQNGVAYPAWHGAGWRRTNAPMVALLKQASHVFYQSQFCKDTADRFLGVQPERWEILHNAVDVTRFVPAATRPDRPLTLLLGGSQYARYRVETALRTLTLVRRRTPDARLLITGFLRWPSVETPRADADRLADELGVRDAVEYLGEYSQAEAPSVYHRADILLHTKYNDPCPTVVIEALACGVPVVYSSSGGVPELVGDHAGAGIPTELSWEHDVPPDPDALGDAVLRVCHALPAYASAARERAAERFDLRRWLERHARVFEGLVA